MFGVKKKARKKKHTYEGKKIQSFSDLSVGDYVIHENHGLGIFPRHRKVEVSGNTKDYIKIEYGDGGNLYISYPDGSGAEICGQRCEETKG